MDGPSCLPPRHQTQASNKNRKEQLCELYVHSVFLTMPIMNMFQSLHAVNVHTGFYTYAYVYTQIIEAFVPRICRGTRTGIPSSMLRSVFRQRSCAPSRESRLKTPKRVREPDSDEEPWGIMLAMLSALIMTLKPKLSH